MNKDLEKIIVIESNQKDFYSAIKEGINDNREIIKQYIIDDEE